MSNEMKKTTEWDLFKEVESNREVNDQHVRRLANAIHEKNLLHLNPIIVDEQMRVIDGQHRLEAARRLNVPIFYIVDSSISATDISTLNSNKKNWALIDYVNFFTVEKKPGFSTLSKFLAEHPNIPLSSAIGLLHPFGKRDAKEIMTGYVNAGNSKQAETIAQFLRWLRNYYEFAYQGGVISIIRQLFDHPDFDEAHFKKKIEDQPRSLVKCVNAKQYKEMFLEIYNYRCQTKRLEFR